MKKLPWVLAALICSVALCVAAYKLAYPTYTHRYRLTIDVDTPHGLKTGSGVIESRFTDQPNLLPDVGGVVKLIGDAVFVDLGDGKNVTALLAIGSNGSNVDGPLTLAVKAFKIPPCKVSGCEWRAVAKVTGARELPPELTPTLVTLTDLNNPNTARVVTPDGFEKAFGPGFRLKRVWIEMSTETVTRTIKQHFPWVGVYKAEVAFENKLRETGGPGGGSLLPGMNLTRD